MSKLERTTFEFSRAREYFELKELSTLTGQQPENFATVVLKELVDNASTAVRWPALPHTSP